MVNPINLEEHFASQAEHFIGEAIQEKLNAVAYCEDFEDAVFWENLFSIFNPNYKFQFEYVSLSKDRNRTTGKNQCLQFIHCLNKKFVLCIDSDYDNLLSNNPYQANPFIFQTYAYSIENHLCYAEHLNAVIAKSTQENLANHFSDDFFNSISPVLFEILAYSILSEQSQSEYPKNIARHEFDEFFNVGNINNIDLNTVREVIENKIQNKQQALKNKYSAEDISTTKVNLNQLGINTANAFKYIKGHAIFNRCVLKIVKEIANKISLEKFKNIDDKQGYKNHLDQNRIDEIIFEISHSSGYPEIERIKNDFKNYLQTF